MSTEREKLYDGDRTPSFPGLMSISFIQIHVGGLTQELRTRLRFAQDVANNMFTERSHLLAHVQLNTYPGHKLLFI